MSLTHEGGTRRELLTGLIGVAVGLGGVGAIATYSNFVEQRRQAEIDLARLGPLLMERGDFDTLGQIVGKYEFKLLIPSEKGSKPEPTIANWGESEIDMASLFNNPEEYDRFLKRARTHLSVDTLEPYLHLGLNDISTLPEGESNPEEGKLPETHLKFYIPSESARVFARTEGSNSPVAYRLRKGKMPDGGKGYILKIDASADALSYAKQNRQQSIDGTPFPSPDSNAAINPIFSPQIVLLPINIASII